MNAIPCATRRGWLRAGLLLPLAPLGACASLPGVAPGGSTPAGRSLLERAAMAHGLDAYRPLHDVNLAYDGRWHGLVKRLQPVLVDADYRVRSEERLLLRHGLVAQRHTGPGGEKFVLRRRFARAGEPDDPRTAPSVRVWVRGAADSDPERLAAAALVADAWPLFQFGPLHLVDSDASVDEAGTRWIDGRLCDAIAARRQPGLGEAPQDDFVLYVDRAERLMRRVRFTLNGLASTRGAVVEVDVGDYVDRHGIRWPTSFFERLIAPIPYLPVHRWRLTGLDVNRLYRTEALLDPTGFRAGAADPATPLWDRAG